MEVDFWAIKFYRISKSGTAVPEESYDPEIEIDFEDLESTADKERLIKQIENFRIIDQENRVEELLKLFINIFRENIIFQ